MSRDGIERRNAFFQGSKSKPVKQDVGSEQEAEVLPTVNSRDAMKTGAKTFLVQRPSESAEAEPDGKVSFDRTFAFGSKGVRQDGWGLHKQAGFVPAHASKSAVLRSDPLHSESDAARSVDHDLKSASGLSDLVAHDLPGSLREATAVQDGQAVAGPQDRDPTLDLVLDILADHGLEAPSSELATQVVDLASRLRTELRAALSSAPSLAGHTLASQTNTVESTSKPSVADDVQGRVSFDVQRVIEHASLGEWKTDPILQQRAGLWALHVAAKRTGFIPASLQAGFKTKSVEALGRLALQALSSTSATHHSGSVPLKQQVQQQTQSKGTTLDDRPAHARFEGGKSRIVLDGTREGGTDALTKSRVRAALADMNTFFSNSDTQMDLQLVQDGLEIDTTADELFDAFVETLRNDELDESGASSRWDAFQSTTAHEDVQGRNPRRAPSHSTRSVEDAQRVQARAEGGSTVRFRLDMDGKASADASEGRVAQATSASAAVRSRESGNLRAVVLSGSNANEDVRESRHVEY